MQRVKVKKEKDTHGFLSLLFTRPGGSLPYLIFPFTFLLSPSYARLIIKHSRLTIFICKTL
jgi:hypothetical protein